MAQDTSSNATRHSFFCKGKTDTSTPRVGLLYRLFAGDSLLDSLMNDFLILCFLNDMAHKYIVILTFLFLHVSVSAQTQLPNADMEQWTIAVNGTDSLIGWSSSNAIVIPPVQSLYQESNAWEGKYAANVVTAPFGFVQYSTVGVLVNGVDATFSYGGGGGGANVDYAGGGGTALTNKPLGLSGNYRTETLTPGDQPIAKIVLTKTDPITGMKDTIGLGSYTFPASTAYSPFYIPIQDLKPGIKPDTILTIFYSSDPVYVETFSVWSNLYLDSLNLVYPTTSTDPSPPANHQISIAPNPCRDEFTLTHPKGHSGVLEIYSLTGRLVLYQEMALDQNQTRILVHDLPSGIYLVKIFYEDRCSIACVQVQH